MNTDEPEPDAMDAVRLLFWIVAGLTLATRLGCFN
jgi:hypothetical protein